LLRFVAGVIDQRHSAAGELETCPTRDCYGSGEGRIRGVAAERGADPGIDLHGHPGIVARHGERRGVDASEEFQLVIDHGEVAAIRRGGVRVESEVGGVFREGQGDALFELGGVDRAGEGDGGDQLLEVGVGRILIELAFGNLRGEWLAVEREFVVFKFDAGGQDAFASQANGEIAIDRPVVFWGEL